jgi:hypothetical protein
MDEHMFAHRSAGLGFKRDAGATDHMGVDNLRSRSPFAQLAVSAYVFTTAVVALFSVGWASAPYEGGHRDNSLAGLLVGLGVGAVVTAWAMALAFRRGDSPRAGALFAVSLVTLGTWATLLPPL